MAIMATILSKPRERETTTGAPKPIKVRRWRKLFWRLFLACVCIGTGLTMWAKWSFDRIEARALRISEAGISLNKFLATYATAIERRSVDGLLVLYDDQYISEKEGLWTEVLQSDRDGVQVYNWKIEHPQVFKKADVRQQVVAHFSRTGKIEKGKFKISAIEDLRDDGSAVIRCVLWLRGSSPDGETLESRTWFRLTLRPDADNWRIASQKLLFGQTVRGNRRGFTDITQPSGIDFIAGHNPMLNTPEWEPKKFGIMKYSSGAVCTADYDDDGLVDILFADGGSARLYRNLGNGQFRDVTSEAGLPLDIDGGTIGLMVDFDNDGNRDLLLCRGTGENHLFQNKGDGTFEDVTAGANVQGIWVATAAAADYNNDQLVDIYLGRYLDPRTNLPTTSFYTRNGVGNTLLRNDGGLRFTDVTDEAGVRDGGLTLGISWGDYNDDGYSDIYVANDFGRNALFKNNGDGTFVDVAEESGTINLGYGMSSQFADIDNDGDLDIYVAAVHSGQRWFGNSATIYRYLVTSLREGTIWHDYPTYAELYRLLGGDWRKLGEEVLKGNTLMLNNGDGTFVDVTEETRVNPHGWYWGSCMFDFDNDGRQDIYTANGWITGKQEDDL
jgi:hypothetical protein